MSLVQCWSALPCPSRPRAASLSLHTCATTWCLRLHYLICWFPFYAEFRWFLQNGSVSSYYSIKNIPSTLGLRLSAAQICRNPRNGRKHSGSSHGRKIIRLFRHHKPISSETKPNIWSTFSREFAAPTCDSRNSIEAAIDSRTPKCSRTRLTEPPSVAGIPLVERTENSAPSPAPPSSLSNSAVPWERGLDSTYACQRRQWQLRLGTINKPVSVLLCHCGRDAKWRSSYDASVLLDLQTSRDCSALHLDVEQGPRAHCPSTLPSQPSSQICCTALRCPPTPPENSRCGGPHQRTCTTSTAAAALLQVWADIACVPTGRGQPWRQGSTSRRQTTPPAALRRNLPGRGIAFVVRIRHTQVKFHPVGGFITASGEARRTQERVSLSGFHLPQHREMRKHIRRLRCLDIRIISEGYTYVTLCCRRCSHIFKKDVSKWLSFDEIS